MSDGGLEDALEAARERVDAVHRYREEQALRAVRASEAHEAVVRDTHERVASALEAFLSRIADAPVPPPPQRYALEIYEVKKRLLGAAQIVYSEVAIEGWRVFERLVPGSNRDDSGTTKSMFVTVDGEIVVAEGGRYRDDFRYPNARAYAEALIAENGMSVDDFLVATVDAFVADLAEALVWHGAA